jgi:hypothetical protein
MRYSNACRMEISVQNGLIFEHGLVCEVLVSTRHFSSSLISVDCYTGIACTCTRLNVARSEVNSRAITRFPFRCCRICFVPYVCSRVCRNRHIIPRRVDI